MSLRLRSFLRVTVVAVLASFSVFVFEAHAKSQVFTWETELCRASTRYDDQKVTAAQLGATLKLNADRLVSIYDEDNTQAQDDAEHRKNQAILQNPRNFIAHPIIETVRQRMIARDQFFYDLQKAKRNAQRSNDYQMLNQFAPSQSPRCQPITKLLQSPSSAIKTAQAMQLLKASCRDNADPLDCVARSQRAWAQSASAMQSELLNYHWHNCVNHQQPSFTEAEQKAAEKAFGQTVGKIRYYDCEEP